MLAVNSQTRTLTLDREITLPSSGTTLISLVDGQGSPVSVEVQSVTDGVKVKVSRVPDGVAEYSVLVLIRTLLRLAHMDTPSPLTLLVTRKTPSKTSHLTTL